MRRILMVTGGLAMAAIVGDTLLWQVATRRLQTSFVAIEKQLRDNGWRVEAASPIRGGWPFHAMVAVAGVSLDGGERALPGGLSWAAERIELRLSWLHPRTLYVVPEGQQQLRMSRAPALVFSADPMQISVPIGDGRPRSLALSASSITGGLAGSRHQQDVRLARLSLNLADVGVAHTPDQDRGAKPTKAVSGWAEQGWFRWGDGAALQMSLQALQVELPDTGRWPLGGRVAEIAISAALQSPPLSGDSPMDQAKAWRDGHGTLNLQDMTLRWGPLVAGGTAKLTLDPRLQPAGSGLVRLKGYNESLDALAGGGSISQGLASTAKAVLGLMAAPAGNGAIDLPLALQDNTVSVGKIPLARLGDIVWRP